MKQLIFWCTMNAGFLVYNLYFQHGWMKLMSIVSALAILAIIASYLLARRSRMRYERFLTTISAPSAHYPGWQDTPAAGPFKGRPY